jgi:hypothetical protein
VCIASSQTNWCWGGCSFTAIPFSSPSTTDKGSARLQEVVRQAAAVRAGGISAYSPLLNSPLVRTSEAPPTSPRSGASNERYVEGLRTAPATPPFFDLVQDQPVRLRRINAAALVMLNQGRTAARVQVWPDSTQVKAPGSSVRAPAPAATWAETPYRQAPERRAPRLSDLKRALRWLRAQYQKRAEEAARGQDRMIERIRKSKTVRRKLNPGT